MTGPLIVLLLACLTALVGSMLFLLQGASARTVVIKGVIACPCTAPVFGLIVGNGYLHAYTIPWWFNGLLVSGVAAIIVLAVAMAFGISRFVQRRATRHQAIASDNS